MNEREHAVLSLFYREGNRELTPSFLAYRMRISTRDATALLDKMVKHGTLDLDFDDEGNLLYRLPESERRLLSEHPGATASATGPFPSASQRGPKERPGQAGQTGPRPYVRTGPSPHHRPQGQPPGTDASPGYGDPTGRHKPNPAIAHSQSAQDGTDGSLYPLSSGAATATSTTAHAPSSAHPSDFDYDDWYEDDFGNGYRGHHRSYDKPGPASTMGASGDQYGTIPEQRSLAPYQTADHYPAPRFGPYPDRERIPVLAGALSLLVPGLGQFYNGEIGKGVMLLFSCLLLSVFLLFWIVWIWSVIDAYMVAEQSNQRSLMDESPSPHPHLLPDQRPPTSTPNSNAA